MLPPASVSGPIYQPSAENLKAASLGADPLADTTLATAERLQLRAEVLSSPLCRTSPYISFPMILK